MRGPRPREGREVQHRVRARDSTSQCVAVSHVAHDDLEAAAEVGREKIGPAREDTYSLVVRQEAPEQVLPDESGRSGDEGGVAHGTPPSESGVRNAGASSGDAGRVWRVRAGPSRYATTGTTASWMVNAQTMPKSESIP